MRVVRPILVALFCAATPSAAMAGPAPAATLAGAVDQSFGSAGVASTTVGGDGGANAVAVQPDGKIVLAGQTGKIDRQSSIGVTRFNPDGTLDPSFGVGGKVTVSVGASSWAGGVLVRPDGRLLLSGTMAAADGHLEFAAVRLNANGQLDRKFGNGGVATYPIGPQAMAMTAVPAAKDKIVIGGSAQISQDPSLPKIETLAFAAIRINANGTLDTSYGSNGVALGPAGTAGYGLAMQPDGRLLWGGESVLDGTRVFAAGRLTSAGRADPTFGSGGVARLEIGEASVATGIALDPNGSVILAGPAFNGNLAAAVARLSASGVPVPSFGRDGVAEALAGTVVNGLTRQADGRIVVACTGGLTGVRFNADGSVDTGFGQNGIVEVRPSAESAANAVTVDAAGRLLLAGTTSEGDGLGRFSVARVGGGS